MAFISSSRMLSFALMAVLAVAAAIDRTTQAALVGDLKTSPTELNKIGLLPSDSEWIFDYFSHEYHTYSPGGVVNANVATFPATVGNGMTMAWLSLGPCAMLPPHYHPRAANYVVAVEGTTETYMILENGARLVTTTLTPGKMTVFPRGSLHSMQNTG
jgi:mannose-6-phosphate isomerase-like protein (cupin superfamily)